MTATVPGPHCQASAPGPRCPARCGAGADLGVADFVLIADDRVNGPDWQPTMTEIFGYFRVPGEGHDEDVILTAGLEVPIRSPIATLARHVTADPVGTLPRKVGDLLRQNVIRCPCTTASECPALDELSLVEAMERVRRFTA